MQQRHKSRAMKGGSIGKMKSSCWTERWWRSFMGRSGAAAAVYSAASWVAVGASKMMREPWGVENGILRNAEAGDSNCGKPKAPVWDA